MEQKIDPHLGFWGLSSAFQLYQRNFKKFSWVQAKMECVERRQSSVIIKIFLIRFFYMMDQQIDPPT